MTCMMNQVLTYKIFFVKYNLKVTFYKSTVKSLTETFVTHIFILLYQIKIIISISTLPVFIVAKTPRVRPIPLMGYVVYMV